MNRNDKFIARWRPISEKGIKAYFISGISSAIFIVVGSAIILYFAYKNNISFFIKNYIIALVFMMLGVIFNYFRCERKYNDLLKLIKNKEKD